MVDRDKLIHEGIDAIVNCDAVVAVDVAGRALAAGMTPEEVLNEGFVAGIRQVGDAFESGEVFLPELMLAANAMNVVTKVCNEAAASGAGEKKGTVVVGTVQGDLHDIGKTIVVAYLKAHGYAVADCGRDVPAETFIARAKELNADVIGLSALLTTSMEEQKKVIAVVKADNLPFKTVVGGAACTQRWADSIGADAYGEDAVDGVKKIDALLGK